MSASSSTFEQDQVTLTSRLQSQRHHIETLERQMSEASEKVQIATREYYQIEEKLLAARDVRDAIQAELNQDWLEGM
ncbi:hypothetical protein [Endozoicomonas arenosclerae]|uniref:hypothetical protein n=1 Tax=Endozoicomonas arenosclerae TaxID=1633495 RepID=UPI00078194C8|nr:hypothetical protein [Endozoicomonas arenosclerae]